MVRLSRRFAGSCFGAFTAVLALSLAGAACGVAGEGKQHAPVPPPPAEPPGVATGEAEDDLAKFILEGMVGSLSPDVRVVAFTGELVARTRLEDHWPVESYLGGGSFDVDRAELRVIQPLVGGLAPGDVVEVLDLAEDCGGTSLACEEAIGAAEMRSATRGLFVVGYRPSEEAHPASGQAFSIRHFSEETSGRLRIKSRKGSVTVAPARLGKAIKRVWFPNDLEKH